MMNNISKVILCPLKGKAAESFIRTLNIACIKQYAQEEREKSAAFMKEKLQERKNNR